MPLNEEGIGTIDVNGRSYDIKPLSMLIEANLEGAHLEKANLRGARLIKAHLEKAHLNEAHLERALLKKALLNEAHLEKAHLEKAHLEEAHLEKAHLEKAHLEGAYFDNAYLEGAYLQEAKLQKAYLRGADLKEAHLEGAHLEGAYLEDAHLEGAHLEGAHLEGAHLEGAYINRSQLEYLSGAYLDDVIYAAEVSREIYTIDTVPPVTIPPLEISELKTKIQEYLPRMNANDYEEDNMDVNIWKYLQNDKKNHIVFYFYTETGPGEASIMKRSRLNTICEYTNNVKYNCHSADDNIRNITPDKYDVNTPYLSLRSIYGSGGIVELAKIKSIFTNLAETENQIYVLKKSASLASSTVSLYVLQQLELYRAGQEIDFDTLVSAAHCQSGQDENIYDIYSWFIPPNPEYTELPEIDIKHLFQEWFNENHENNDVINLDPTQRKNHFINFVREQITAEQYNHIQERLNSYIERNNSIFETLKFGGNKKIKNKTAKKHRRQKIKKSTKRKSKQMEQKIKKQKTKKQKTNKK